MQSGSKSRTSVTGAATSMSPPSSEPFTEQADECTEDAFLVEDFDDDDDDDDDDDESPAPLPPLPLYIGTLSSENVSSA